MNGMLPLLPWRYALHSLEEMPERKLQRDQVTYNAVLKTLENKWQSLCLHGDCRSSIQRRSPLKVTHQQKIINHAMSLKLFFSGVL